ncbi:MAG: DUF6498-containing protein [Flavobacteriaceae bacterium]|nr:hypothetical protein [Flavobacteriaceae bacterium]
MKTLFLPNKYNYLVWGNALLALVLLLFGAADPLSIVFAYFLETIIIGLFHCIKLWMVNTYGKESPNTHKMPKSSIGIVLFFLVHYGMFVGIQSIFVFAFFQSSLPQIKEPFHIIENYGTVIHLEGMPILIASFFVSNLKYFYTSFWQNNQYKEYSPSGLFFRPYVRIIIQQVVVILAGFFFIIFSEGFAAAILLIIFRLVVDLAIVGIHRDATNLDKLLRNITKDEKDFQEAKKRFQEFSE